MSDERKQSTDWPVVLLLVIALPTAFVWGGFWIGLVVLVIGIVVLGWSKRHEGPFPTNKRM